MDHTHWATVAKCSLCGTIPESAPLFQCSFQHPYCYDCIAELKRKYKGSIRGGATCVICRLSGVFQPSTINNGFLKKIKARPGIGRVCRYTATPVNVINGVSQNKPKENKGTATNDGSKVVSVESLFHLPSDQISKLIFKNGYGAGKGEGEVSELSKRLVLTHSLHSIKSTQIRVPILCPHNPCGKMVSSIHITPSSFVSHFKYEHAHIPKYNIERGRELCIPFDVSNIEHGCNVCLAMINVYEINRIDVKNSLSTQSVIKTCSKFSQQIPIDSFWLMVTGSEDTRPHYSYAFCWLFNMSDECYQCTIELSSLYDSMAFSSYCDVNTSPHNRNFSDIEGSLNCLIVTRESLEALLTEGAMLNLRIVVH
nr:unnamed protein product [Callosobruchus chinensis]